MTAKPDDADSLTAIFGEPISTYTADQAIEDGYLQDATPLARLCKFMNPSVRVIITTGVMTRCVMWDDETERRCPGLGQSTVGRIRDLFTCAQYGIGVRMRELGNVSKIEPGEICPFTLSCVDPERGGDATDVQLWAVLVERDLRHGADAPYKVTCTILLPEEN